MIDGVTSTNDAQRVTAPRAQAPARTQGAETTAGTIPESPPPEVLAALDAAAGAIADLQARQVNLSFKVEGDGAVKRIRIEVRDASGALVREIPTRQLVDLLAGDTRGVTVDTQG